MANHPLLSTLVLTIMVWSVYTDCPLSHYPRQTTIGYIRAEMDPSPGRANLPQIYEYPLVEGLKSSSASRTAVGVIGLSLEKKSEQFGYKIQVSLPGSLPTTVVFKVSVVKGSNNDRWRYILFNFLVSETPDLLLGTKSILQFSPASNTNALKVREMIALPSSSFTYRMKPKIFLSGLHIVQKSTLSQESISKIDETIKQIKKLEQYSWNVKLIKKFVTMLAINKMPSISLSEPQISQNGQLTFEIVLSQIQLRAFTYSYLIYLEKTNSDALYQTISGVFSFSDEDIYLYSELENDAMKILGITGFTYSTDTNSTISLDIQYGKGTQLNFFQAKIEGFSTQFSLSYFGISMLPGAVCKTCPGSPLIFQQFCVTQCPLGFVSSINSDGSFYCHECSVENFLIPHEDKQSCVCASGHYLISPSQTCDRCPYDCLTCNGNVCLTCDTPTPSTFRVLNQQTGRCQCLPSYMGASLYDDRERQVRKCVQCNSRCKTCLGPQINSCLSCPPFRTFFNGICKCQQNFIEDKNDQCVCLAPYALQNGKCVLYLNKCKQNEKLVSLTNNQKVCMCNPGYSRSLVSNICLKQCQSYEDLNYQTQECECKRGFIRDKKSKVCIQCSSKLNQVYNQYSGECECIAGYEMNKAGICISCPPKTYYNTANDACECIFNYYRSGNACVKCRNERDGPGCRKLSTLQGMES